MMCFMNEKIVTELRKWIFKTLNQLQ